MSRPHFTPYSRAASNDLLELLTTRQYLRPHEPVREVLRAAVDELGCCSAAVKRGLEWLTVDPALPVGRLRRSELIQLGKSISRFWRQASQTDAAARHSQT